MSTNSGNRSRANTSNDKHPAQYLALAVGVAYLLVGLAGFAVTGFDGFADPDGDLLLGIFEVNPLHNIVHLLIGGAGVALWSQLDRARIYGWLLAVGYGATFVYGLFVAETDEPANFLALNNPDNWLHLVSALLGLVIALWPADRATTGTATWNSVPPSSSPSVSRARFAAEPPRDAPRRSISSSGTPRPRPGR